MESILYNQKGKEVGKIELPDKVFGAKWRSDLVHQVAVSMMSSARLGLAHTKNRGEVSGGGRKPWRQKGTGRARHGSTRSPLWVGGGVTHGPRNDKDYSRKINKKMKKAALFSVLSAKVRDNELILVDFLVIPEIKTKEALSVLSSLSEVPGFEGIKKKKSNAALLVLDSKNSVIEKSFRNIKSVTVGEARNLNVVDLLQNKFIIMVNPKESFKMFS